jgi:hypothetical protein
LDPTVEKAHQANIEYHEQLRKHKLNDSAICIVANQSYVGCIAALASYFGNLLVRLPFWLPGALIASPMSLLVWYLNSMEIYWEVHPQNKAFVTLGSGPILFVLYLLIGAISPLGWLGTSIFFSFVLFWLSAAHHVHNQIAFNFQMICGIICALKLPKVRQ